MSDRTSNPRDAFERWIAERFPGADRHSFVFAGNEVVYPDHFTDGAWEAWSAQQAEIERLRAALQHYNTGPTDSLCSCGKCDPGKMAREALGAADETDEAYLRSREVPLPSQAELEWRERGSPKEVGADGACSKCGGTHYGSYWCPMQPDKTAGANK
jgi:hypothetical protein